MTEVKGDAFIIGGYDYQPLEYYFKVFLKSPKNIAQFLQTDSLIIFHIHKMSKTIASNSQVFNIS